MYNKEDFTYGYEIEFGDIDRTVEIPKHLGAWEYCECDVLNLHDPYKGIAVDPAGINPPMGGEINTKPTNTWEEQVERIMEIKSMFPNPTSSVVNHGHLHVRVPGLTEDIEMLKVLTAYFANNQQWIIPAMYGFKELPEMKGDKNKTYLKYDGGRHMPNWLSVNLQKAKNFEDYIRIYCCGKDGVSRGRPLRFGINLYCLKHTNTIEFRCLRSSTEERHIADSFAFAEDLIYAALVTGEDANKILERNDYIFPPFNYSRWESDSWGATKYKGDAAKKRRKFHEVA